MKKISLLVTVLFTAICLSSNAQQFYSKPFITKLDAGLKTLNATSTNAKDTVMNGKKLLAMLDLMKGLQETITQQVFGGDVIPVQIDSFKISQGQASPYRGAGLGVVRNYNHIATNQQLSFEIATDTTQFYSIRYYKDNSQTITKSNPNISIEPVKINDQYQGFVYKTQGYSFLQIMLDNAYLKVTVMDGRKDGNVIPSPNAEGFKKLAKKMDVDKLNKATSLK